MDHLRNLDWQEILNHLETLATSEVAKEVLRNLSPVEGPSQAQQSFSIISQAQSVLAGGDRPHAESLDLYTPWFLRLQKQACLKTIELKDIRHFCLESLALEEVLQNHDNSWAQNLLQRLMRAREPLSAIDQIITASGEIRSDASEVLYSLFKEKQSLSKRIHSTLDRLVKETKMEEVLQDRYVTNREGRWVLPVKSGMQHDFSGIIHGASHTKQTVFMEPQDIVPLNNRLRQIEAEIELEIERLLTDLSLYLSGLEAEFAQNRQVLIEADVCLAKAALSRQLKANPCEFSAENLILSQVRHPQLLLQNQEVIANSIELNAKTGVLLLSGPNAGGKTVLLKAIGLAAQMARCGLPICAEEGSQIPFFRQIKVAIGDAQSVDAHLSTFAAHLKVLNEATQFTGWDYLLLIDEICGSTDPEEGTALARSFIESFARQQIFAVITSHLGPLKLGWSEDSGVTNGSLEYDSQTGQPTYQFLMGIPGQSLAIETASRVGVSPQIVERAIELLSPEAKAHHQAMSSLESVRAELSEIKKQLSKELSQARKAKEKYTDLLEKFRREKDEQLQLTVKKAEKKLDEVIRTAVAGDIFRRHEKIQEIRNDFPEIIRTPRNNESANITSATEFAQKYPPGTYVFVPSIGREGVIQGEPNSKGEIPILSESMRLFIHWKQLEPSRLARNPTAKLVRRSSHSPTVALNDQDRTVDLRGKSADEAIELLEIQLDRAAMNDEERIKVIHGHGTDTLKKAVRNYLSRSTYVQGWSAGGRDSGGDGITWIQLKD